MGMNAVYEGAKDCPEAIPLFPLGGALLLPRGQMPLNIFEPRYLAMIDDALKGSASSASSSPSQKPGASPRSRHCSRSAASAASPSSPRPATAATSSP